jgi:hypothetical protein
VLLPEPESPGGVTRSGEACGIGVLLRPIQVPILREPARINDPAEEHYEEQDAWQIAPQKGHTEILHRAVFINRIIIIFYTT